MSEELIQRNLIEAPEKMGDWNFYNIGATTLKALKGAKIIPDRDYDEYEKKKPDALIVKKPLVIAAIEYKQPKELRTDKQVAAAIAQELGTAQALQAKIYIVTDGKKSYWINPVTGNEILQEDGSRITLNFDKKSTECITLINKIRASISATNDQIKAAATVDPLPLAEKVWQDLWAVSGATPENCLYTFVEIFIFKYLSDLGVLRGMYSFYDLLGKYAGNNDNEVLEYYASVMSGSSNLKEEIAKQQELKEYFAVSAMGIEGLFMEWIVRALKPGGKAFIVVPDGIMNRSNDKKLRDFILEQCFVDAVISLPLNTFFTTNKKTYILALTKKTAINVGGVDTLEQQTTPVFTYLCSEIGETRDVYRFDIDQNDLETASDLFNMFKGAKAKFKTSDRRCKIVDINEFVDAAHWCVDRWWTHEEKIELGIEDSVKSVDVDTFRTMLSDVTAALFELDEPLCEISRDDEEKTVMTADFNLTDLFDIYRGSGKYTKAYVQKHKGEYGLFSGNTFGRFADIDAFDYDMPCLTWAIDGLAGYIMIHDEPFSATNHRGVLVPKVDNLNLQYVKYVLEPIFRELKKGRQGLNGENEYTSLPPFMIKSVKIPIPVDNEGNIDLTAQEDVANKYLAIERCKKEISEKLEGLIGQKVKI